MNDPLRIALLVCSDRAAQGQRRDETASRLKNLIAEAGAALDVVQTVADDRQAIESSLRELAKRCDVVLTSGGTGVAARDVTVDATLAVVDSVIPGMGEAMRARSLAVTPMAMLSRAAAGTLGHCVIVNLPGSPSGAFQCLEVVLPVLPHCCRLLAGEVKDCQKEIESTE